MTEGHRVVLLSSDITDQTGWGRFTREFCSALQRKSIPFELHLPRMALNTAPLPFAVHIQQVLPAPCLSFGKRWWRIGHLWQAARSLQVHGELIHSLVEFPYSLLAAWLARRDGLPFGFTAHGTYAVEPFDHWFDRLWFQRVVREANFIGAVSQYTAHRLRHAGRIERPITVVPNGVDIDRFPYGTEEDRQHARETLEIAPRAKVILCVGALKARKGINVLLQAFSLVRRAEPRTHLLLVGPGEAQPYQRLAAELGVEGAVHLLGTVDHEQLVRCYHACDVFTLLPRSDPKDSSFEGFGLVYLEANACGRPVVGARSGGVPDAVQHGHTGLLVEPEDPESAAHTLLRLLRDPALARRLGEQGRAWAEQHTWDRVVDTYIQVYRSAVS